MRARDAIDNWGTSTDEKITVDTVPPCITLNSYSSDHVAGTKTLIYTGSIIDAITNIVDVEYQVNGEGWQDVATFTLNTKTPSFNFTTTSLNDGVHTITVRAKDEVENWGASTMDTVMVDTTPPNVILTPYSPDPAGTNTLTYSGNVTDDSTEIKKIEYIIDTGGWIFVGSFTSLYATYTFTTPPLINGQHTITIKAWDKAGNMNTGFDTVVVDVDAPTVILNPYTTDPTNNDILTYNGTATSKTTDVKEIEYKIDGGWIPVNITPSKQVSFTFTTSKQVDGPHTITVRAKNEAGNYSVYVNDTVVIDTTSPDNPLSGIAYRDDSMQNTIPDDEWNKIDATPYFVWNGAQDGSGCGIEGYKIYWGTSLNSIPDIDVVTSAYAVPSDVISNSIYYLRVKTKDKAGNWSKEVKLLFTFKYDNTLPANPVICTAWKDNLKGTLTIPYEKWQNIDPDPYFEWSDASDPTDTGTSSGIDGYRVYWGPEPDGEPGIGATQAVASYTAASSVPSDSPYYLRVRTMDNAGNWSDMVTLFTFKGLRKNNLFNFIIWTNVIIPFAMEFVLFKINTCQFLVRYINTFFIMSFVKPGSDFQSFLCFGITDQIDNCCSVYQRLASPILGNKAKHFMLNFIPFAGARRKV